MRTPSRPRRSWSTLAALGGLAAVVALAGSPEPTTPAAAAAGGDGVRALDFSTVAQPGIACADAVTGATPRLIGVRGGSSGVVDRATLAQLTVDPDVHYGDLDGDGEDEAVVQVTCDYGANGAQGTVQVWSANGRLAQLVDTVGDAPDDVADESRFPPAVAAVDLDGAAVEITWSVWADDDPNCCPSEQAVVDYRLDGGLEAVGEATVEPAG